MVKAALYGPAASKIPAPQINFSATVAPSLTSPAPTPTPTPAPHVNVNPVSHQNIGLRGAAPNQSLPASQGSQLVRPLQNLSAGVATQGIFGVAAVGGARPASAAFGIPSFGKTGGAPEARPPQIAVRGSSPASPQEGFGLAITTSGSSGTPAPRQPQYPSSPMRSSDQVARDSKPLDTSANGIASDSLFGGDLFSTSTSHPKQDSSPQGFSSGNSLLSSAIVPVSGGNQHSTRTSTPGSLQSSLATQPVGPHLQQAQPAVKQNQHVPIQTPNMLNSRGLPVRLQDSASGQPQSPWPRMTPTDVQKYTRVFMEVDTDRDGKITGDQARNLFLSWRLPRGIFC